MSQLAPTRKQQSLSQWIARNRAGLLFILPALLVYILFFVTPFISSIYYSFTDWNGIDPVKRFVGLDNFARLLQDRLLWLSLRHNLTWIIVGTVAPIVIGLPLAVLLSSIKRGRLIFQTAYFLPYILSGVVVGMIWGWIYNPLFGLLNYMLRSVGLDEWTRAWLGDPAVALYAVIAAAVWGYVGFCIAIFVAGLQNIDHSLIEAATIDGANAVQRFFHVIIPQLRHVLNMVIVFTLIGGFNVFDIVQIMTKGGPANHTELIATYTYKRAFQENAIGYGATLSLVMTILSLVASYLYIVLRDRNREEDEA